MKLAPQPSYLRRLTNTEYEQTLRDLTGDVGGAVKTADLPSDPLVDSFDNNAEVLTTSLAHVEDYAFVAHSVATDVFASETRRVAVVGCDLSAADRSACLRSFIERFGRRAFRRPLSAAEVSAYVTLAGKASDTGPNGGASLVFQAMLQSPHFLYWVETGRPDAQRPELARLTGYEVATRLAYVLWGTTPDEALLDAAGQGGLDSADSVRAKARAMLAGSRARDATRKAYSQWMRLHDLDRAVRDAQVFPFWNEALKGAMLEETTRFVDDLIWRDGASFLDLLSGRYSFVNPALSTLYGVNAPDPSGFARVAFAPSDGRAGLLTQASFLTMTSRERETSPLYRGLFVRTQLLCQEMSPPPPGVDTTLPPPQPGETQRQRNQRHSTDPVCASCHTLMEPVGFGLEGYDAIGARRHTEDNGMPVDTSGRLLGFTPEEFNGAVELADRIRDAPEFPACMVTHAYRYAHSRRLVGPDGCAISAATDGFRAAGYSYREMLVSLVSSDAFLFRVVDAAPSGGP